MRGGNQLPHPAHGERIYEPELTVVTNQQLLGFSDVVKVGTDSHGNELVDVHWHDGQSVRQIPAATPAFSFYEHDEHKKPALILTIERAHHIQSLHLEAGESGSYFTPRILEDYAIEPITLKDIVHQVAAEINTAALEEEWKNPRRTLEMPIGDIPGREAIISLNELLSDHIVSQEVYNLLFRWKPFIIEANLRPGIQHKHELVKRLNGSLADLPGCLISFQVVRIGEGGAVVAAAGMVPRPTNKMMVELSRPKLDGPIFIHTIAPGRKMPRHPIPALHRNEGTVDDGSLEHSLRQWAMYAHIVPPPDEETLIHRTLGLLASHAFKQRLLSVQSKREEKALKRVEIDIINDAHRQVKEEVKEIAAARLATTVAWACKDHVLVRGQDWEHAWTGTDWQHSVNEARNSPVSSLGRVFERDTDETIEEFLNRHYLEKTFSVPENQFALAAAARTLERKRQETQQWLEETLEELRTRVAARDEELLTALAAWNTSPDSTADRAHDGKGYHAGLLHYFEYRGAREKHSRLDRLPEPPTVDGFIAFTNRLKESLDRCYDLEVNHQSIVVEDTAGNQRIYILLPGKRGEFIVGYKKATEPEPKLSSMFDEVTQQAFERMVGEVLSGRDRGQVNRLVPGPVHLKVSTVRYT